MELQTITTTTHDETQEDRPLNAGTIFGDLYEWKDCFKQIDHISSLQIHDDINFSSDDLAIVCKLAVLKELFLHNLPSLSQLPSSIARLSQLRVLIITNCLSLTSLPLALKFLHNLETLRLDCSSLTGLPLFLPVMTAIKHLLIRKAFPVCRQCKEHVKKTTRVLIYNNYQFVNPFDEHDIPFTPRKYLVTPLSVLAASSFLSVPYVQSFYVTLPGLLWPVFEDALSLDVPRCGVCLVRCQRQKSFSVNFTRLLNCKCLHLCGYICSKTCQDRLAEDILRKYPYSEISTEPVTYQLEVLYNRQKSIRRRLKKIFVWWLSCVPFYGKRSYTVTHR